MYPSPLERKALSIRLTQEAGEVFVFPTPRLPVTGKLALTTVEFVGVHAPTPAGIFVWDHRVKHFVIEHVLKKPERHERLIEQWIDSNHPVLFLDRSKNKIIFGPMSSPTSPHDFITAQPAAKMTLIQSVKDFPQIEILSFMAQIQLTLHRQHKMRDFPFCFFGHDSVPELNK